VIRGERLIKLGDSWFSTKSMEVEMFIFFSKGSVIFLESYLFKESANFWWKNK